jgi:hypothetical protein
MASLLDRVDSISDKLKYVSQMHGTVQYAAMSQYLEHAVRIHQETARNMIARRLDSSGLQTHTGQLKLALSSVKLVLTWNRGTPRLSLVVPGGLPKSIYARIWSLDKGWKINGVKTRPWKCFTLSRSEKNSLGEQIMDSALQLMNADSSDRRK